MAAAMASPWPVFPEVGSTIVPPGFSRPARSAASIIRAPMRSLTLPPGFSISSLANTEGCTPAATLERRTRGVSPIASRKFSRTCIRGLFWRVRSGQHQAEDAGGVAEEQPSAGAGLDGEDAAA